MKHAIVLRGLTMGVLAALLSACGPTASGPASTSDPVQGSRQQAPAVKRITAAVKSEPKAVISRANQSGIVLAGADELEQSVHANMVMPNANGNLIPQLAVAVPSIENGLWKLLPDGRMETVWQIKPNARWHDGTPVAVDDLLFTLQVVQDRDMPYFKHLAYDSIESAEAVGRDTLSVKWKQPFIDADLLLSQRVTTILPRHLLEKPYLEDKGSFEQLPFWNKEFVGTGAFKLREWNHGSGAVLEANPDYVLGRPKIDEVNVVFITDPAALAANLLAGAVDLTMGRNISLDQALQIRDQWRDGTAQYGLKNWIMVYPQFVDPNPTVVTDVRFRRALVHAIDRQEMVDSLLAGLAMVAHTLMNPGQPDYAEVERRVPKYEYDPRKATAMLEDLGYSVGTDGGLRDASSQRLGLEIRTTQGDDLQEKSMFAVSGYWQRIGIAMEPIPVPPQRSQDRAYRSTFPSFDLKRQPNDLDALPRIHSSKTPLAENNFVGDNYSRYMNPQFDALLDRYFVTIPRPERIAVVSQVAMHIAETLNLMGLFYQAEPTMVNNRISPVSLTMAGGTTIFMGNVNEWDVK